MHKKITQRVSSFMLALMMILTFLPVNNVQAEEKGPKVIIYEVYGGGGNSKAIFKNDYVVLKNIGDETQNLEGWSIQYASATKSFNSKTLLKGEIKPNEFYLIKEAEGSNIDALELPKTEDVKGDIKMSSSKFKLALSNSEELIEGKDSPTVVDFIGVGTANEFYGENPAKLQSNTTSNRRVLNEEGYINLPSDNSKDYELISHDENTLNYLNEQTEAPNPSQPEEPITGVTVKEAREVESGNVVTTSGIVTFIDKNNITIQDDTAGIVVRSYDSNVGEVKLGDKIEATGTRGAFNGLEQMNNSTLKIISSENTLPEPKKVTLEDLSNNEIAESLESQRIILEGVILGAVDLAFNTTASKGEFNINIFRIPDLTKVGIKEGDTVDVVAVLSEFKTYQLRVLKADDIKLSNAESPVVPEEPVEPEEPITGVTVKEAREVESGNVVTTSGIVTFIDKNNITIQDDTAGIVVRSYDSNVGEVKLGDKIEATGTRGAFNGLEQMDNSTFKIISSENSLPEPKKVTLIDLTTKEIAETLESQRILLEEVSLREINPSGNTPVHKDGKEINIYRIPDITKNGIEDYAKVNVIAVLAQYNDYQLRVADVKDVILVENQESPEYTEPKFDDPISIEKENQIKKEYPKALNIAQALEQPLDTEITVFGVATHSFGGGSSLIIEDIIDGKVEGYQIFGPTETVEMGDIVVVTGKHVDYYSTLEMSNVSQMRLVEKTNPIPPQEVTAEDIKNFSSELVNEYVYIKDVTLPEYKENTTMQFITDMGNIQTYRAPEYPIGTVAGDKVDIKGSISTFNGTPQIRLSDNRDYVIKDDKLAPFVIIPNLLDARATVDYVFTVSAIDNVDVKSIEFTTKIGAKTLDPIRMVKDPVSGNFKGTIPGEYIVGNEDIELSFKAEDVNGNITQDIYLGEFKYGETKPSSKPVIVKIDNRPHVIEVSPKTNSEVLDTKTPEITVEFTNGGDNPKVELILNDKEPVEMTVSNNKATYKATDLKDGKINAKVIVTRAEDNEKSEEFTWSFYMGRATVKAYFGQIHSHSNYSDGSGSPKDAVSYASQVEGLDFFSLTDHSNYFDDENNLGNIDDSNSGKRDPSGSEKSKWQVYKEIVESFTTEDFLSIYGYEMTWTKSGANYGHINTYNSEGFVSRNNPDFNDKTESKGLLRYYEMLTELENKNQNVISQLNHPGDTFGNFDDFGHYSPEYDKVLNLVEVGNGEGEIRSKGYFPSYDQYTMALDKGWHISPSNNQDNHKGKWGDANTARTVVIADNLDKSSLFEAIRQNRVYATEDNNLFVDFTVNNQMMGSRITGNPKTLKFNVNINDEDSKDIIGTVSVISNRGEVKHSEALNSNMGELNFEIPNDGTFYYIRIDQVDKDIAVTSPVWTSEVEQTGIDSITKSTNVEYLNKDTDIITKFVNSSATDISLSKVEYYEVVNGKEILIKTVAENLPTIKSKSSTEFKEAIKPSQVGKLTLVVKAYPKEVSSVWTGSIELSVYDEQAKISKISEAQNSKEGLPFVVEGRLTSNTSGYDKNTAFFDSGYIQDETGGINIFPISGKYQEGQKLRIFGITSSYQGERQLNIDNIELIDENIEKLSPTEVQIAEVKDNVGLLVKVKGEVDKVEKKGDIIETIILKDKDGNAIRIFIDGYIGYSNDDKKTMPEINIGQEVEAIGLSSIDPVGNRIRIRNRADVNVVQELPLETQADKFKEEVKEEEIYKGDEVNLLDNILNLPEDAKIKDITTPKIDTNKIGEFIGKVEITFSDNSTKVVEIKVIVKEKTNTTPTEPKVKEFKDIYTVFKTSRISGTDRFNTAIELSKKYYNQSENVVITSGRILVDTLMASPFATELKAPILLVEKDNISKETLSEINRLKAKNIIIVGGDSTVSNKVERQLKDSGFKVTRKSGSNRYETAIKVGEEVINKAGNKHKIVLTNGDNLIDSLTGNSIATKERIPVLLTLDKKLETHTINAIEKWKVKEVLIVGGKSSVYPEVEKQLQDMGISVTRLKGRDRLETAVEVAKYNYPDAKKIIVANGYNYVDALVAGPITKVENSPIILFKKSEITEEVKDYLNQSGIEEILIVGGDSSISD
ncbi:MAG: cell wall-binding repeat-containing protein [Lagierella massiliensis]|nr:cell wall-binding repeat-containing protein [Lagierella massiliensis]